MIGFGNFGRKRNLEIESLSDERLVMVDTTQAGFYDNVRNYTSENDDIQEFVKAVREVKDVGTEPFYRPVMDPSLEGYKVVYKKGCKPVVGYSFDWWEKAIKDMPAVEGRKWQIGTEYQYYAFLVFLINQLVETGWHIKAAVEAVVLDSKDLGHYRNPIREKANYEPVGSRKICGIYDLANTYKILACTNGDGFWRGGGTYLDDSDCVPLADINHINDTFDANYHGTAWLVLK